MTLGPATQERHWISLGDACRILEVNEDTLRQWANRGAIRVFRTPGGHRRFLRDDVYAVLGKGRPLIRPDASRLSEEVVLRRIRRRLQQDQVARQRWYADVNEERRLRMRLFGRRLLSLLMRAAAERRVNHLKEEARLLGMEHALEMAGQGIPLKDTLEAFVFFRNNVMESAPVQSRRHMEALVDQVLLGIGASYERMPTGERSTSTESR